MLAGEAKKDKLKAVSYLRQGGLTRLTSMSRTNEPPKPNCAVCSDDSASIATVRVKSMEETKLRDFVETILPDHLSVSRDGDLMIDFDGKIIFERSADMSEDESAVFNNRLAKSLAQLGLKPFSNVMISADLIA